MLDGKQNSIFLFPPLPLPVLPSLYVPILLLLRLLAIKASQCYFLNISQLGIIFHSIFNRGEPGRYCMHAREWRV